MADDPELTLDEIILKNNRHIKIWINEEQKIKLGLLAILLFWDTKYRDFKIILGQCRSKNFRIGRGRDFFSLARGRGRRATVGSPLKTSERSSILKMLRAKGINDINVEESIYSGGIILGNTHPFILNKWNLAPYMHM